MSKSIEIKIITDENGSLFALFPDGSTRTILVDVHGEPNYGYLTVGFVPEIKPLTNYDLLIRKSPEDLAEWHKQMMEGYCPRPTSECPSECYKCWLDWLRQEVKDGYN